MTIKTFETAAAAQAEGFATFNNCPTIGIDIPNDTTTISVRTSRGEQITFSFLSYVKGGAPDCVDVQIAGGQPQNVIAFSKGSDAFRSMDSAKPVTLTTFVFPGAES